MSRTEASVHTCPRKLGHSQLRGKCLDAVFLVTHDIWQILSDGNDNSKRGGERCDEHDGGAPDEGEADRCPCSVEDAEVQEKPTDGGDDEEGRDRKALEAERGDAADGVGRDGSWVSGRSRCESSSCNSRHQVAGKKSLGNAVNTSR